MDKSTKARAVLGTAAASLAASLILSAGADAQSTTSTATSGQPAAAGDLELQEVVVTATRQAQGASVHDVPLTITAVTSEEIQKEGLKRVEDLQREVPGLQISGSNSGAGGGGGQVAGSYSSSVQVSIRGITSTVSGAAPTTGIYVDDVPLQLRAGGGAGGTALPLLFDLERVEVLKGPQGTLYGGSSEGGTVRFITEQPSFDRPAFATEVEGSKTQYGNGSYETGLAAGAPIISDVLAVHASGLFRHDGGYIQHVSQFTGDTLASDTNVANHEAVHAVADLKIGDQVTVSFSYLWQFEDYSDTDNYWLNMPGYTATTGPGTTSYSYGPYNQFGPFRTGSNTNIGQNFYTSDSQISAILQPHSQSMSLPSVTVDWHPGWFDVKNVVSYNRTRDHSYYNAGFTDLVGQAGGSLGPNNQLPGSSPFVANLPVYSSYINGLSDIGTETEELRFSSAASDSPLTWVGGVFIARDNETSGTVLTANFADAVAALRNGVSQTTAPAVALDVPGNSNEIQKAVYGQVDYLFFDHLKATLGLRYSTDTISYRDFIGGSLFGFPPGLLFPSTTGSLDSHATTPKFGLQYIVDPSTNYYATVAEGYRPGGFNGTLSPPCVSTAEALGIIPPGTTNPAAFFSSFKQDKLWSYEFGGKFRPFDGRASINASLFYIDWKNVQTAIGNALVCGSSPAINAGTEKSEGGELEASVVIVPGLTTTLRGTYVNAHYSEGVNVGPVTLINEGDRVAYSPHVQGDLAAEYRFPIGEQLKAFVRGDWSYQSGVVTGTGPGTPGYAPDNHTLPSSNFGNARLGVEFEKMELALFMNNISNSEDVLFRGGFAGGPGPVNCTTADCSGYRKYVEGGVASTYRPRTIGIDFNYRY